MSQILVLDYWFKSLAGNDFSLWKVYLIIAAVFVVVSIAIFILYKKYFYRSHYKKLLKSVSSWALFFGVMLAFLTFFRLEGALILSMRVWLALWGLGLLVWLVFVIRSVLVERKKALLRNELNQLKHGELSDRQEFEKYLPKPKNRR